MNYYPYYDYDYYHSPKSKSKSIESLKRDGYDMDSDGFGYDSRGKLAVVEDDGTVNYYD